MKIGVITAMDSERVQIAKLMATKNEVPSGAYSFTLGHIGNNDVILTAGGIGKVNAALTASEMIKTFKPDCIISTGVAGGIDKVLSVMDVVVSSELLYHDVDCGFGNVLGQIQGFPPRFKADASLLAKATSLKSDTNVVTGLIATGDRFVSKPEDVAAIKALFPEAIAVDMESCSLAQTCYIAKVPFISFRIISDVPGKENHFAEYQNFWKEMADRSFGVTKLFLESI